MKVNSIVFTYEQIKLFRDVCNTIREYNEFIGLSIQPTYLFTQGSDYSNVSLYEMKLFSNFFYEYNFTFPANINLNGKDLIKKVFSDLRENEMMTIKYLENDPDHIQFCFYDGTGSVSTTSHSIIKLKLYDLDQATLEIPDVDYDVYMSMDTKEIDTILKKLELFDDKTAITCCEEYMSFASYGLEGEYHKTIAKSDMLSYTKKDESHTCKLIFSLKHIRKMLVSGLCNNITHFSIEHSYPLKISYMITDDSYFVQYLAPKTDEDEYLENEKMDDLSADMINMDVGEGCYDTGEVKQEKPKKRKITPVKKTNVVEKKVQGNVKKVVKKEKVEEIEDSDDTVSLTESDYNEKCKETEMEDVNKKMTIEEKKEVEKECFGSSSQDEQSSDSKSSDSESSESEDD